MRYYHRYYHYYYYYYGQKPLDPRLPPPLVGPQSAASLHHMFLAEKQALQAQAAALGEAAMPLFRCLGRSRRASGPARVLKSVSLVLFGYSWTPRTCDFKLPLIVKALPHPSTVHVKGRAPSWTP